MFRAIVFTILLYLAILLEGRITTLPVVLDVLLFLVLFLDERVVLVFAFLAGVFLDFLTIGAIGIRSIYFLLFVVVLFLYWQKFEVKTVAFVATFSFFGGILYLLFFGYTSILLQAVVNSLLCIVVFYFLSPLFTRKIHYEDRRGIS